MIILLFICIMFLFFFKPSHRGSHIQKFTNTSDYNIKFLNKSETTTLFNNFKGVEYYQPNEIRYRSQNKADNVDKMRKLYQKNSMEFTKDEKNKIKNDIKKIFLISNLPLIKNWNFLKISSSFDFGLPYTINDTIILPSNFIGKSDLYETLLHEQFHILQYQNPIKFHNFYTQFWNFRSTSLPSNSWINNYFVTNPDGYRNYYIFESTKYRILPLLLLLNEKMVGLGIFVDKNNKIIKKNGKPIYKKLSDIKDYFNKFYKIKQNYHPHEIFANLMVKIAYRNVQMDKDIKTFLGSF